MKKTFRLIGRITKLATIALGCGVGLAVSPMKGDKMRDYIADKADSMRNDA